MIFKTVLAFCIGWGVLYATQHFWLAAVIAQVSEPSGLQLAAPAPAFPTIEIDPEKLRQAINPPITIDTGQYERLAIEGMTRDIVRQNNDAMARARAAATPPYIPGLPRH